MSIADTLGDRSKKDLADMARRKGVRGFETMTKDDLVRALTRAAAKAAREKEAAKASAKPAAKPARTSPKPMPTTQRPAAKLTKPAKPGAKPVLNGSHPRLNGSPKPVAKTPMPAAKPSAPTAKSPAKPAVPAYVPKPQLPPIPIPAAKDLSSHRTTGAPAKDRVLLMVRDPFWLHANWELTSQSVQRAEAALKQDWHGAKPVIRLFDVTSQDTTSTSETPVRDIFIQGGCNDWYIDVPQPPRTYRADIGYISRRGEFYVLARSNQVTPPKAGSTEAVDVGWTDLDSKKAERILAMSSGFETAEGDPELKRYLEERLRRPMGTPSDTAFGSGAVPPGSMKKFFFELDAKLVVMGKTDPAAHVTLQNEPVKLSPDGTFVMWFSLPDSRQIIPAVASSSDGVEERTIVLAVERNTKHLDPMIHDQMNEA